MYMFWNEILIVFYIPFVLRGIKSYLFFFKHDLLFASFSSTVKNIIYIHLYIYAVYIYI